MLTSSTYVLGAILTICLASALPICEAAADPEADAVAQTIAQLRSHDADGMNVDSDVQTLLREMKQRMRALVLSELDKTSAATPPDTSATTANIANRLRSAGVLIGMVAVPAGSPSPGDYVKPAFGHIENISLSNTPANPGLVLSLVKFALPCGSDVSLSGFSKDNDRWITRFAREENNYSSVTGAIEELTYGVSSSNQTNSFLVVSTAAGACVQAPPPVRLTLSALKVGPRPDRSSELFKETDQRRTQMALSSGASIVVEPDSFEVGFQVPKFLERGLPNRRKTIRFVINDDALVQTPPRVNGNDRLIEFVDEWAALPGDEARSLATGTAEAIIHCRHEALRQRAATSATPQFRGLIASCRPGRQTVVVGFIGLSETFYVSIGTKDGVGAIVGVNTTRPDCNP